MCGRFYVEPEMDEGELRAILDEVNRKTHGEAATGEVFPGSTIAALANSRSGGARPYAMYWGYRSVGSRAIINARSETAAEKPMFRDSYRLRRCIIPASAYFEWRKPDKQKFIIRPNGERALYMAGLYRIEKDMERAACVILTRNASGSVAQIHDRMPLILPRERLDWWLSPQANIGDALDLSLELMEARPAV